MKFFGISLAILVDGGWSSWGPWGTCKHGCGVSLATRFRNCTQPAPLRGGFTCNGLASQVTNCDSLAECKVEGVGKLKLFYQLYII